MVMFVPDGAHMKRSGAHNWNTDDGNENTTIATQIKIFRMKHIPPYPTSDQLVR